MQKKHRENLVLGNLEIEIIFIITHFSILNSNRKMICKFINLTFKVSKGRSLQGLQKDFLFLHIKILIRITASLA